MMDSLPIRVMGFGLYSVVEVASYAFVVSRGQSCVLKDRILRDSGIYGTHIDFERALDGLNAVIPDFELSIFTRKDIVPPKAQHVLASALFSKSVRA